MNQAPDSQVAYEQLLRVIASNAINVMRNILLTSCAQDAYA